MEFHKNASKADGLQTSCKSCKKNFDSKYFQSTKEKAAIRKKDYKRIARQWVWDYLKQHSCVDCGEKDPVVLEFDHQGGKRLAVSEMIGGGYSLISIGEEIGKCEVRCANCHRRKTAKDFNWYKDLGK